MQTLTEVLREYEVSCRDLVRFKTLSTKPNKKNAIVLKELRDWSFICTALDVIGDTTLAIKNFLDYGLEGMTDGNDDGEKYLRLYGVLNATYLQQEAMQVLISKINLRESQELGLIQQKIKDLEIRDVRRKIGSHSSDYRPTRDIVESYVLTRHSMRSYNFSYKNNEGESEETWVDLSELLTEHLNLMINFLDKIYEKTIETVYSDNQLKRSEELGKLTELRKLKSNIANNI